MNRIFSCVCLFGASKKEASEVELGRLQRFSLRELEVATDYFSDENILGRGGFSEVYKGHLTDGSVVAVKRLKEESTPGGEQQFQTELKMISMAVHRNLLRIRGYCITQTERLLVYPYMVNGSLASRLRGRGSSDLPLDWQTRKRIALGAARGLSYLNDYCNPKIIHRDVKASNILLDGDLEAVVGDFGLAKPMGYDDTHVTTAVCGTLGHIAPEYMSTGKASVKTDVYGYGIMLLELISGQRAFDLALNANAEGVMLRTWVKGLVEKKNLELLIDIDLLSNYVEAEMEQLMNIALLCTRGSPMDRPKMAEVVNLLEDGTFSLLCTQGYRPNMSEGVRMLEDDGLDERGSNEWENLVLHQELELAGDRNSDKIFDSTDLLQAIELSGPR